MAQQVLAGLLLTLLLALIAGPRIRSWWKQRNIGKSPGEKITILLAKLDGDASNNVRDTIQECIQRELGNSVTISRWHESLTLDDGLHETAEAHALQKGRRWLEDHNADLLVWGRLKSPNFVSLRFTAAIQTDAQPQTYALTPETLDLPTSFISDLRVALAAYAVSSVTRAVKSKTYMVPTLQNQANQLDALTNSSGAQSDDTVNATLLHCCGRVKLRLYDLLGDDDRYLRDAISLNRRALLLRDRERSPDDWAASQAALGACLGRLGERTGVVTYFDEAESALKSAQSETTREKDFLKWVGATMSLAAVYMTRGRRESSNNYLEDAVQLYDEIAIARVREDDDLLFATIQNNKGIALLFLAERKHGIEELDKALAAFTEVLEIRTQTTAPFEWAEAKVNFAAALAQLGERTGELGPFQTAVQELNDALTVITRERTPRKWAIAQANLGNALVSVGAERIEGAGLLRQAISALRASLEVLGQEGDPIVWTTVQLNLARAQAALSDIDGNINLLTSALTSFSTILSLPANQSRPRTLAAIQLNHGYTLLKLAEWDAKYIDEACDVFETLLQTYSAVATPDDWTKAQLNLGRTQRLRGETDRNPNKITASLDSFSRCFDVISLEKRRVMWGITNLEIAKSYLALAELDTSPHNIRLCRTACNASLQAFEQEPSDSIVFKHIDDVLRRADELENGQ